MSVTSQTSSSRGPFTNTGKADCDGSEPLPDRLRRVALGTAWALKPPRTNDVPAVLYLLARHYLGLDPAGGELPDPETAFGEGIAGICTDLDPETLVEAYGRGLFPFCHVGPYKWWAPRQRMVLRLENFDMEKNLRRRLRNKHFDITFDRDFEAVMRGCAELRPGRLPLTWITPAVIDAYCALFEAGHAHSVEARDADGKLVGGAYGVSVGGMFFTESQFNNVRDAAKAAFATLNCHLQYWGYALNDGKNFTPHLARVGFELVSRRQFAAILGEARERPGKAGRWSVDETLDVGNWDPAAPAWRDDKA